MIFVYAAWERLNIEMRFDGVLTKRLMLAI